jgi:RNA polymerase sigma-70 factor (ECF subfamily)
VDVRLLLTRVAAGDREAFHAVYDLYGDRVMAMIRERVTQSVLAGELVQNIFVAAWQGASGYREDLEDPEDWLLGITRHKLLDHGRRMRRIAVALGMQSAVIDASVSDLGRRLALEQALTDLPDEQRRVVDLIYECGLTLSEAARALKIPTGTVTSRVNAALTAMRACWMRSSPP